MTEEYINLEKIRYGNQLELHIDMPHGTEKLYIAPLLLLPFIENCFKHGISNILDQPWLSLHITTENNLMTMKLLNSKPANRFSKQEPGIGIENVRKRLALLYPNRHELVINEEEEVFIVILKVELEIVEIPTKLHTQPPAVAATTN
jgi:LytS/YehU family sensor histidine kinase